jgi:putative addiction module killer protein
MYEIKRTDEFDRWFGQIRNRPTRIRLLRRLEKAQRGLLGDVSGVGGGIYEMREFFGPGWRMYYLQMGQQLIIMLGGGNKGNQSKDIEAARVLADRIREADNG